MQHAPTQLPISILSVKIGIHVFAYSFSFIYIGQYATNGISAKE